MRPPRARRRSARRWRARRSVRAPRPRAPRTPRCRGRRGARRTCAPPRGWREEAQPQGVLRDRLVEVEDTVAVLGPERADHRDRAVREQHVRGRRSNRGICCHAGGAIDFDADGNLYLSTGDDSNPFASDGYAPLDERTTRNPAYDAQRSGEQQRPTRQGPGGSRPTPPRRRTRSRGRQPLPRGVRHPGEDPPRDLRDGFPQSVPDDRRQAHWLRLLGRVGPDAEGCER